MAIRPGPLSPAAFGIDAVGVLTRHVSPGKAIDSTWSLTGSGRRVVFTSTDTAPMAAFLDK